MRPVTHAYNLVCPWIGRPRWHLYNLFWQWLGCQGNDSSQAPISRNGLKKGAWLMGQMHVVGTDLVNQMYAPHSFQHAGGWLHASRIHKHLPNCASVGLMYWILGDMLWWTICWIRILPCWPWTKPSSPWASVYSCVKWGFDRMMSQIPVNLISVTLCLWF